METVLVLMLLCCGSQTAFYFLLFFQYMGCIEVLKSMRSLDFNTRTQVTR